MPLQGGSIVVRRPAQGGRLCQEPNMGSGLSTSTKRHTVLWSQCLQTYGDGEVGSLPCLGFGHVQQFMTSKGIDVLTGNISQGVPIKCIVFELKGTSRVIVVIINQEKKVSLIKLAGVLGVKRQEIVMVPGDLLVTRTGYQRGEVPPFGFVDKSQITRVIDEGLLTDDDGVVRFGPSDLDVCIRASDLVFDDGESTRVASLAEDDVMDSLTSSSDRSERDNLVALPQESQEINLIVHVVRKRKLAKRLVFATVVPCIGGRAVGTAYAIRGRKHKKSLLWKHPTSGEPCELQCIFGKSLERRYGKSVMEGLLKKVVKGGYIHVVGAIQNSTSIVGRDSSSVDFIVHDINQASLSNLFNQQSDGEVSTNNTLPTEFKPQQYPFRNLSKFKKHKERGNDFPEYISSTTDVVIVKTLDDLSSMVQYFTDALSPHGGQEAFMKENAENVSISDSNSRTYAYKYKAGWMPRMVVSLDAEWRPSMKQGANNPVSIVQLGTHGKAFLIDMLQICFFNRENGLTKEQILLSNFLDGLFSNPDIVKLGFGLRYDIKRLNESYHWLPCFSDTRCVMLSHVDVLMLARIFTSSSDAPTKLNAKIGLNTLVSKILHKSLDKEEQISDWGSRPLTESQIRYAVADVSCLIDIYDSILQRSPEILNGKNMVQCALNLYQVGGLQVHTSSESEVNLLRSGSSTQKKRPITDSTCDLDRLKSYKGKYLPIGGKLGVVKACLQQEEAEKATSLYRIPRGGAVIEMSNAFLMFVNIPSKVYPNTFESLDNGLVRMSWWTSVGQTRNHPVVARLLSREKSMHLFCRKEKDKYIYFGGLDIDMGSVEEQENGQIKLYFILKDYASTLESSPLVAQLLSMNDKSTLSSE